MITIIDDSNISIRKGMRYIYFYSPTIIFNKKMVEMILKMEKEFNITFEAIDVYHLRKYVSFFTLKQLPTILILNDGKFEAKIEGLPLTKALRHTIREIINKTKKEENNDIQKS